MAAMVPVTIPAAGRAGGTPELAVMASLALVSVLNYAYTAVLVWLLPPKQYAVVGAASSLLLVCGTIAAASVPWVLAREIAKARDDPARRQAAVSFSKRPPPGS
jgi:O-antigen/teichoic acid export membrane protein